MTNLKDGKLLGEVKRLKNKKKDKKRRDILFIILSLLFCFLLTSMVLVLDIKNSLNQAIGVVSAIIILLTITPFFCFWFYYNQKLKKSPWVYFYEIDKAPGSRKIKKEFYAFIVSPRLKDRKIVLTKDLYKKFGLNFPISKGVVVIRSPGDLSFYISEVIAGKKVKITFSLRADISNITNLPEFLYLFRNLKKARESRVKLLSFLSSKINNICKKAMNEEEIKLYLSRFFTEVNRVGFFSYKNLFYFKACFHKASLNGNPFWEKPKNISVGLSVLRPKNERQRLRNKSTTKAEKDRMVIN